MAKLKAVAILIGQSVSNTLKEGKKTNTSKGQLITKTTCLQGTSSVVIPANLQNISKYIQEKFFPNTGFVHLSCFLKRRLVDLQLFQSLDGVMIHEDGSFQISVGN